MPLSSSQKPFIVPLFIPHAGCPHRCVFCNQTPTTGMAEALPTAARLHGAIAQFLSYRRDHSRYTEISFFGGNFLGLPADTIVTLLDIVSHYVDQGDVNGIRFSTRPDTIDVQRLKLISAFPVTTIEVGVQSMDNSVLAASQRGHTAQDVHSAVALLKNKPYALGLQMMIGLPGDTPDKTVATGEQIAALAPDFVRIYPTLVIEGSRLARWYRQGRYTPMGLDAAVDAVKDLLALFTRKGIKVIRMGLQPTDELNTDAAVMAGPFHPAFGEMVHSALWLEVLFKALRSQGQASGQLDLCVHPRRLSRVKGNKNSNIKRLKIQMNLSGIHVAQDPGLPLDVILVNGRRHRLFGDATEI